MLTAILNWLYGSPNYSRVLRSDGSFDLVSTYSTRIIIRSYASDGMLVAIRRICR